MKEPTYSIDLKKKKNLYYFSENDIPTNLGESLTKSAEQTLVDLTSNGGFLLLPHAFVTKSKTEKALAKKGNRKNIISNIINDKAPDDLLGLMSFRKRTLDRLGNIDIEVSNTLDFKEAYEEEALTIHLEEPLDHETETLDFDLTIFTAVSQLQKGISSETSASSYEVLTEAVFYDEEGEELYREFVVPESLDKLTDNSVSLNINNINIPSNRDLRKGKKKNTLIKKIKVFIRKIFGKVRDVLKDLRGQSIELIIRVLRKKFREKDRYKLHTYNFGKKRFQRCKPKHIDPSKRTLVLLHGTIKGCFDGVFKKKNSKGSFQYLYNNNKFQGYKHWFDFLANQASTAIQYEQIIAIDHETLLDGPKENVDEFIARWGINTFKFKHPVSILSASRGSLLAKYLSVSSLASVMKIERVAIVAGGYSDYLKSDKGLKYYLNTLIKLVKFNVPLRFLISLTLDVITELPGLKVQSKDSDAFKELVRTRNQVYYFNMANNYRPTSLLHKGLEKGADEILGKENDLLLGIGSQLDHRPGKQHSVHSTYFGHRIHGKGLEDKEAKLALFHFLTSDLNTQV